MTDFFAAYLAQGPVFAALLRGAEGKLMESATPLAEPALDLGCGDGFFSSLLNRPGVFVGVDPDRHSLRRAASGGAYSGLVRGSATALPFRHSAFGTVIANSVLEHIPDVDAAIGEIARVLRPGGRLLITAPSQHFSTLLGGAHCFYRLGFPRLAGAYGRWFNWHSRHFHTDSAETWSERLQRAGLSVARAHYYFPAPAMRAFDLAHYLSLGRLVSRKLTGHWVLAPAASLNPLYARLWRRHADPAPVETGGCIFIEARKGVNIG